MKNTRFLPFSSLLLLSSLFFTHCSIYGPATTGNTTQYIARPFYVDTSASSLQVGVRGNKGHTFSANEKNYFGEAEVNYAHVFEVGHIAFGGGAMAGKYKVVYPSHPQFNGYKSYYGTLLRGEIGLHLLSMLRSGLGRKEKPDGFETSTGFAYSWTTEKGNYRNF